MGPSQVLSIIAAHQETLRNLGVKSLELFGPGARNQATATSDANFVVEFSIEAGLFELLRMQHDLEEILGCAVDLGTKDERNES